MLIVHMVQYTQTLITQIQEEDALIDTVCKACGLLGSKWGHLLQLRPEPSSRALC